jgi:hypothetical protein
MATIAQANTNEGQVRVASGLDVIAGLWLLLSAFILTMTDAMAWSCGLAGAAVVILAATRAFGAYNRSWMSWVNVAIGFWVILSPWVLPTESEDAMWNAVVTGIAIVLLAAWSALATDTARRYTEVRDDEPAI